MNIWKLYKVYESPIVADGKTIKELCIGKFTQDQVDRMPNKDSSMYSIMENLNNGNKEPNIKYYYIVVDGKQ